MPTIEDNPGIVRRMMISTIIDTSFLKGLKELWRPELVGTAWLWLASTCFGFLDEFGSAPGRNIESLWEKANLEPEAKQEVGRMLRSLSSEWEKETDKPTTEFLLAEAERYFARELYLRKAVEIEQHAESGNLEKAWSAISNLKPPKQPIITAVDFFSPTSDEKILQAFAGQHEPMFNLGGDLHRAVGEQMRRDSFVAYVGPRKVGKSYFLQAHIFPALMNLNLNVYYAQCGDLSEFQQINRIAMQLSGRNVLEKYCRELRYPVMDCHWNQIGDCGECHEPGRKLVQDEGWPYPYMRPDDGYTVCWRLECKRRRASSWWGLLPECEPLTRPDEVMAIRDRYCKSVGGRLMLDWFAQKSTNISGIHSRLERLRDRFGWAPDVVIIDFLDTLCPEPNSSGHDFRRQESDKWQAGRRLSQDWGCLLLTATWANRENKQRRTLRDKDISEAIDKGGHVTALYGLNRDEHDRQRGWMRVNPIYVRDGDVEWEQVAVLQCLGRGAPNLGSLFWSDPPKGRKGKKDEGTDGDAGGIEDDGA